MNEQLKELLTQHGFNDELIFEEDDTEQLMISCLLAPNVSRVYIEDNKFKIDYHYIEAKQE